MKMAKASSEEIQQVIDFANKIMQEQDFPEMSNEELGKFVRKAPPLSRIIFGYEILVNNCCDQSSRTLEWRQDIVLLEENYHKVMGWLKDMKRPHGVCEPPERNACTHCMSKRKLEEHIAQYRGRIVKVC